LAAVWKLGEPGPRAVLVWASFLLLFAEILAIRWLGIELPIVRTFPNLILMVALIGASSGMADPARSEKWRSCLPLACTALLGIVVLGSRLGLFALTLRADSGGFCCSLVLLIVIVLALLVVFANLGIVLGRQFAILPPLTAYSWNLFGSIAGVVVFALISWFGCPPPVWILAAAVPLLILGRRPVVWVLTGLLVVLSAFASAGSFWSPYSKLDLVPIAGTPGSFPGTGNFMVNSNNQPFHSALRMPDADHVDQLLPLADQPGQIGACAHYYRFLRLPFRFAPAHQNVLVLGGGSGNDASFALRQGVQHVDIVEIDPVIVSFGKTVHPDKPYLDPRVSLYNEDARSFLRYCRRTYDLIEFAYLDPGCTLNSAAFLRVDNFVYTVESIRSALKHLCPNGVLSVSFATGGGHPVTRRLYQTLKEAAGYAPLGFVDDKWDSVIFLLGPGVNRFPKEVSGLRPWPTASDQTESRFSTDDWPFLYLEFQSYGPWLYLMILITAVICPGVLLSRVKGSERSPISDWANMFFLGQAFMLVETKSIVQLSLLFGATWIVNSVVIILVLLLAFAANLLVVKLKPSQVNPFYIGLVLALALDWWWQPGDHPELGLAALAVVSGFIACLPIFFGAMVFSTRFARAGNASQALSANLLGVAIGGLSENLCIVSGIKSLVLLAAVLYGMSYLSLFAPFVRSTRQVALDEPSATSS